MSEFLNSPATPLSVALIFYVVGASVGLMLSSFAVISFVWKPEDKFNKQMLHEAPRNALIGLAWPLVFLALTVAWLSRAGRLIYKELSS